MCIHRAQASTRFHEKRVFRVVIGYLIHRSTGRLLSFAFVSLFLRCSLLNSNPGHASSGRGYCACAGFKSMTLL